MFTEILKFDDKELIPAIIIHHETNEVLMLGYMNEEAVRRTVETGLATFWSRSGQTLNVKWIRTDCDADALLVACEPAGPVCHEGYLSCFFRELRESEWETCAECIIPPEELYGKKQ